jgi:hypothetical protein
VHWLHNGRCLRFVLTHRLRLLVHELIKSFSVGLLSFNYSFMTFRDLLPVLRQRSDDNGR